MTMSETDADRRAANLAVFEAVLATITAGEYERLGEFMTDDLHFELPYGQQFLPEPTTTLEAWNGMQRMTFRLFSEFRIGLDRAHEGNDPDELIAEYRSDAVVARNGNAYRNRYVGFLRFRDGRICAWREYHDPAATSVL